MKFIKKVPKGNGHLNIYFLGIKVFSYKPKVFVNGKNNIIKLPKQADITLKIFGDNNRVIFEDKSNPNIHVDILIGNKDMVCNNCVVHIGKDCTIGGLRFGMREDNTIVEIGNDCMFSIEERFFPSDMHAILDENDKVINVGKHIKIGNHVWLGESVAILKNTEIEDGCVIGACSVFGGKAESNSVLVGNPARVVKRNVHWARERPKYFLNKQEIRNENLSKN